MQYHAANYDALDYIFFVSCSPILDMDWTGYGYGLIWISLFYYYHYHHRYHYSYHNFIITILCYAPSIITCTVGGAIQLTVCITLHYRNCNC